MEATFCSSLSVYSWMVSSISRPLLEISESWPSTAFLQPNVMKWVLVWCSTNLKFEGQWCRWCQELQHVLSPKISPKPKPFIGWSVPTDANWCLPPGRPGLLHKALAMIFQLRTWMPDPSDPSGAKVNSCGTWSEMRCPKISWDVPQTFGIAVSYCWNWSLEHWNIIWMSLEYGESGDGWDDHYNHMIACKSPQGAEGTTWSVAFEHVINSC